MNKKIETAQEVPVQEQKNVVVKIDGSVIEKVVTNYLANHGKAEEVAKS